MAELDTFSLKRKRLSLIIELIHAYSKDCEPPPKEEQYNGCGLAEAVSLFLSSHRFEFWTPREIAKHLIDSGYGGSHKLLTTKINTDCYRKTKGVNAIYEVGGKHFKKAYRALDK